MVAALGDSLTVSTKLSQESTLLPHWLCVQHLADPVENLPVSGTETQSGSHETSPGNLEALPSTLPQPCSNTTSSHEASLQPQIKAIPSLLPPCSQAFHLYVLRYLSKSARHSWGTYLPHSLTPQVVGLPTYCPAPLHPIQKCVLQGRRDPIPAHSIVSLKELYWPTKDFAIAMCETVC